MSSQFSSIPSVDKVLRHAIFNGISHKTLVKKAIRQVLDRIRQEILQLNTTNFSIDVIAQMSFELYCEQQKSSLIPLVNATGILVHTNLGRSPISSVLLQEIMPALSAYNNLEYNLHEGKRGERYCLIKKVMLDLFLAEDVLVVNNNAAALFLVLHTFAQGKEVIISRGELVEIGGSFRIPEIMKSSGAILKEVGTTNKTYYDDYVKAINAHTAILLKVHCSNYKIEGFTHNVAFKDIIKIAREHHLLDFYDIGSGLLNRCFVSNKKLYSELGHIFDEPVVKEVMELQPSLVCFSGDKLLGSVQAGIILGKKHFIDLLKKNHLLRMLRIDKITLAYLEATFRAYLNEQWDKIPLLSLLRKPLEILFQQAENMLKGLPHPFSGTITQSAAYVGGGALPHKVIPSFALKITHPKMSADDIKILLRERKIIARVAQESLLLDMRTLLQGDDVQILDVLREIA